MRYLENAARDWEHAAHYRDNAVHCCRQAANVWVLTMRSWVSAADVSGRAANSCDRAAKYYESWTSLRENTAVRDKNSRQIGRLAANVGRKYVHTAEIFATGRMFQLLFGLNRARAFHSSGRG